MHTMHEAMILEKFSWKSLFQVLIQKILFLDWATYCLAALSDAQQFPLHDARSISSFGANLIFSCSVVIAIGVHPPKNISNFYKNSLKFAYGVYTGTYGVYYIPYICVKMEKMVIIYLCGYFMGFSWARSF